MASEKKLALLLMVLCTIFTSLGQIFWKIGVEKISLNLFWSIFNLPFLSGFFFYGIGFLLMLAAFRKGELSILYPIFATNYIWVSIASPLIFPDDVMNVWKWFGVLVILLSVSLLGWSSTRKEEQVAA